MSPKSLANKIRSDSTRMDSVDAKIDGQTTNSIVENQGKPLQKIRHYVRRGSSGKLVALVAVDELPVKLQGVPEYLQVEDTMKMVFVATVGEKYSFAVAEDVSEEWNDSRRKNGEEHGTWKREDRLVHQEDLQEKGSEEEEHEETVGNETTPDLHAAAHMKLLYDNKVSTHEASRTDLSIDTAAPYTSSDSKTEAVCTQWIENMSLAPEQGTILNTSSTRENINSAVSNAVSAPMTTIDNAVNKRGRGFTEDVVGGQHRAMFSAELLSGGTSGRAVSGCNVSRW
jgi:hypothetical protein